MIQPATILGRLRRATRRRVAFRYDDSLFEKLHSQALALQDSGRVTVRAASAHGSAWLMVEEVSRG